MEKIKEFEKMPEMIKACPNCGHILTAAETVRTPTRSPGGKFLCMECDYEGFPILIAASQYDRSKFKKKILQHPTNQINQSYAKAGVLVLVVVLLLFLFGNLVPGLSDYNGILLPALLMISIVLLSLATFKKKTS